MQTYDGPLKEAAISGAGVIFKDEFGDYGAIAIHMTETANGSRVLFEQNLFTDDDADLRWMMIAGKGSVSTVPSSQSTTVDIRVFSKFGTYVRARCDLYVGPGEIKVGYRFLRSFDTPVVVAGQWPVFGSPSDVAWDGVSPSPSMMAVLKKIALD